MSESTENAAPTDPESDVKKRAPAAASASKAAPRARGTTTATTKAPARKRASTTAAKAAARPPTAAKPIPSGDEGAARTTTGGDCLFCGEPMTSVAGLKEHLTRNHALGQATESVPPAASDRSPAPWPTRPSGPAWPPVSPAPAQPLSWYKRRQGALLIVLGLAVAGVELSAVALGGGNGGPRGFNDPDRLAADIMMTLNAKAAREGRTARLTDVTCIQAGTPHTFTCHGTASDGSLATVHVTVSADGNTWITDKG